LTSGKGLLYLMDAMRVLYSFLAVFLVAGFLLGQTPDEPRKGRKPVLIRDDPNEKKPEDQEFVASPRTAAESIVVGDFYYKRDNWKAAEMRYREAVRHNPRSPEAYEKLVKSLEKQNLFAEAAVACDDFLVLNPLAKEATKFREKAEKLREKEQKEAQKQAAEKR